MAKKKKATAAGTEGDKPSRNELAKNIQSKHRQLSDAVHAQLRKAGLQGVSVHSIRFSVAHEAFSGPGCNPPCAANEQCVLDSNGGVVRWVCVAR
jgi:hypothetical protein